MTFEEQFPELTNYNMMTGSRVKWYKDSDVQEYCLSKQRVKEAIKKNLTCTGRQKGVTYYPYHCDACRMKGLLLKELGLEDD